MKNHTILIVDDEENILRSLKRIFKEQKYTVYTAISGFEAISLLKKTNVDLIISDQKMPGMDGIELFEKIIDDYPDLIKILITGHAELNDAIRAVNSGNVYKFTLKPWNNEELLLMIKRALEQRDLIIENRTLTDELKLRDSIITKLEKDYPGITKTAEDGVYNIDLK